MHKELKLRNDNVLVFGGSSGIGKAIAQRLLMEEARVTICGRSEEKLLAVKDELKSDNLFCIAANVADVDAHKEVFAKAERLMGGLNAFVNSAAIARGRHAWTRLRAMGYHVG